MVAKKLTHTLVALTLIVLTACRSRCANGEVAVPDAIDLGLSVRWASFNLGAEEPWEPGNYYAWGETVTKEDYSWETYKFALGDSVSKYGLDGQMHLDLADDVVHNVLGDDWRLPTLSQAVELLEKCKWTMTEHHGMWGYDVQGPNGNSIFLPAAGGYDGKQLVSLGHSGYYWSDAINPEDKRYAHFIYFTDGGHIWRTRIRSCGRSVRPVWVGK